MKTETRTDTVLTGELERREQPEVHTSPYDATKYVLSDELIRTTRFKKQLRLVKKVLSQVRSARAVERG